MIRRSTGSVDVQQPWSRPPAMRYLGWALIMCAALLILGGVYRAQSNMLTSGMLFICMGVIFAPDILQKGWPVRLSLAAIAVTGAVYTFLV